MIFNKYLNSILMQVLIKPSGSYQRNSVNAINQRNVIQDFQTVKHVRKSKGSWCVHRAKKAFLDRPVKTLVPKVALPVTSTRGTAPDVRPGILGQTVRNCVPPDAAPPWDVTQTAGVSSVDWAGKGNGVRNLSRAAMTVVFGDPTVRISVHSTANPVT